MKRAWLCVGLLNVGRCTNRREAVTLSSFLTPSSNFRVVSPKDSLRLIGLELGPISDCYYKVTVGRYHYKGKRHYWLEALKAYFPNNDFGTFNM